MDYAMHELNIHLVQVFAIAQDIPSLTRLVKP